MSVLKEEFAPHRTRLDVHLLVLEQEFATLRGSSPRSMPFDRLTANFDLRYPEVMKAASGLIDEARKIDARGLFGDEWVPLLQPPYSALDSAWDALKNVDKQEDVRRSAADMVVLAIDALRSKTSERINAVVAKRLVRRA